MAEKKKNCYNCAYKQPVPGDAHLECKLDWTKTGFKPPTANEHGVKSGWYTFPINFDPVWQTEECKGFSETRDDNMTRQGSAFDLILAILKEVR